MFDSERIAERYFRIKHRDPDIVLLPLQKVLQLEQARYVLKEKYLSKINKITDRFLLVSDDGVTIDGIVEFCTGQFGELNFHNETNDIDGLIISLAFTFSLVTINYYQDTIKFRVDPFWDL